MIKRKLNDLKYTYPNVHLMLINVTNQINIDFSNRYYNSTKHMINHICSYTFPEVTNIKKILNSSGNNKILVNRLERFAKNQYIPQRMNISIMIKRLNKIK